MRDMGLQPIPPVLSLESPARCRYACEPVPVHSLMLTLSLSITCSLYHSLIFTHSCLPSQPLALSPTHLPTHSTRQSRLLDADYNKTHFVRNESFKKAADNITGPTRKIFIEFLERSCTAEFSGFLLYKELARRLKDVNPIVADIFMFLSRDEARHAGFINKVFTSSWE